MWLRKMIGAVISKGHSALMLRACIVGMNFAVMIGLAAVLGVARFGELVFLYSIALVVATVLSVGGPVILLRGLTNGHGLGRAQQCVFAIVLPATLAAVLAVLLPVMFFRLPWASIVTAGFLINLSACMASILRAKGSVMVSMALRDAGPFAALGAAAIMLQSGAADDIIAGTALLLAVLLIGVGGWALTLPRAVQTPKQNAMPNGIFALWGATILGTAIAQMDLIVGGAFLSAEDIGAYALLRRIANVVALPVSVATWVSAAPISAAFGAVDTHALHRASQQGSRIAWHPAVALFAMGVLGVIAVFVTQAVPLSSAMAGVFVVLLIGALLQAFWASGYTVATLTDAPFLSFAARALVLASYAVLATLWGPHLNPMSNALAYVAAMSAGSFALWIALRRRFGVDTSAAVLWKQSGVQWTRP